MPKYLIHISIGPVQSFIEQARKTQDLFAGSALITRLRETAMANLIQNIDKDPNISLEFITPYVSNNRDFLNDYGDPEKQQAKPLQHLYKLEAILNIPISGLETVLNSAKTKIFKEWVSFAEGICKQWGINYDKFCDQIEQLLEVNILANEISDVGDGYAVAYAQQLTALAAFKRSRSFIQNQQNSETGKKCHVDNNWNIRIYRLNEGETTSYAQAKLFADNKITFITREDSVKVWHLGFGEGLSAISAVKRMVLNKPHEYPSTAKVALWNTLHKSGSGGHLEPMDEILSGRDHSNDQSFYRENVNEAYFNKYGVFIKEVRQNKCEAINAELTTLYAVAKKRNLSITKYYGVFKFDGDNSNKWLSGEWIDKKFKLEEFHKAYSYAQYNFVVDLTKKLEPLVGKVVYVVEDFLVFFNLEHFTEVLEIVCASYEEHISSKLEHYRSQERASTHCLFRWYRYSPL